MFCLSASCVLLFVLIFQKPRNPVLQSTWTLLLSLGLAGSHSLCGLVFWEQAMKRAAWCCFSG